MGTTEATDEALVELIRTKDQEKYSEIVSRYQERLFRYARYLVNDDHKATDVVQNALVKAYINLYGFNTTKKFSSWIYRIVHNEAMNELNKSKRVMELPDNLNIDSGEYVDEQWEQKHDQQRVKACLSQLPLAYAEPLSLYYLEEKSYEDISDILRLSVGTVSTRIRRAKLAMRKLCQLNN